MSTFDPTAHPRRTDGRFATKNSSEPAGEPAGLDLAPTEEPGRTPVSGVIIAGAHGDRVLDPGTFVHIPDPDDHDGMPIYEGPADQAAAHLVDGHYEAYAWVGEDDEDSTEAVVVIGAAPTPGELADVIGHDPITGIDDSPVTVDSIESVDSPLGNPRYRLAISGMGSVLLDRRIDASYTTAGISPAHDAGDAGGRLGRIGSQLAYRASARTELASVHGPDERRRVVSGWIDRGLRVRDVALLTDNPDAIQDATEETIERALSRARSASPDPGHVRDVADALMDRDEWTEAHRSAGPFGWQIAVGPYTRRPTEDLEHEADTSARLALRAAERARQAEDAGDRDGLQQARAEIGEARLWEQVNTEIARRRRAGEPAGGTTTG